MAADVEFDNFFKSCDLEDFQSTFVRNGVFKMDHLEDVEKSDLTSIGLSEIQIKRFYRIKYSLWTDSQTSKDSEQPKGKVEGQSLIADTLKSNDKCFLKFVRKGSSAAVFEPWKEIWVDTQCDDSKGNLHE